MDTNYIYNKIKNFSNKKNKKYRSLNEIDIYLKTMLGCNEKFYVNSIFKIKKRYSDEYNEIYCNNNILIFFILDKIRLEVSHNNAKKMSLIKNLLEDNEFNDQILKIKYFNKQIKKVIDGPTIIILKTPLDSIIIDNEESSILIDLLKEAY